jgi:hypothetical protein
MIRGGRQINRILVIDLLWITTKSKLIGWLVGLLLKISSVGRNDRKWDVEFYKKELL